GHRIDDAEAGVSVDLEALLVAGKHFLPLHVDVEYALVDHEHPLEKRDTKPQARVGLAEGDVRQVPIICAHRLARPNDHDLLGFPHDDDAGHERDDHHRQNNDHEL